MRYEVCVGVGERGTASRVVSDAVGYIEADSKDGAAKELGLTILEKSHPQNNVGVTQYFLPGLPILAFEVFFNSPTPLQEATVERLFDVALYLKSSKCAQ